MTNEERAHNLQEAENCLQEAINYISLAVEGTRKQAVSEAYVLGHLRSWLDGDNSLQDTALPKLIEHFDNGGE